MNTFGNGDEPQITSEGWCLSLLTFCSASNLTESTNGSYAGYLKGSASDYVCHMKRDTDLAAREHEILPYEDAKFIADIIEDVWFVDASTPDANHVLVPGDQKLEPFQVLVISKPTAMVRVSTR